VVSLACEDADGWVWARVIGVARRKAAAIVIATAVTHQKRVVGRYAGRRGVGGCAAVLLNAVDIIVNVVVIIVVLVADDYLVVTRMEALPHWLGG
jgi:hypothetical protein